MKFVRVTVGDNNVCDTCVSLENTPANTMKWWESSGLLPRVAPTECDGKCRCGMSPVAFSDIQAEAERLINEAVENSFDRGIQIDLTEGRRLLLKDFTHIEDIIKVQYETIANMESLIYKWKVKTGGKKLPPEYFKLTKITDMVKWLEKDLNSYINLKNKKRLWDAAVGGVDIYSAKGFAGKPKTIEELRFFQENYLSKEIILRPESAMEILESYASAPRVKII